MRRSIKEMAVRLLILLAGLTIAHFGVTLFIFSNQGTDPFNVLVQGVFRSLDSVFDWSILTHGNVHMTLCIIIMIVLLFVDRSYIKIGTIVCMFLGGPIIDLFTIILQPLFVKELSLVYSIILLVIACIILAFGMTIVIKSDAGTGPNDLVSVALSDKLRKKFGIVRIVTDACFVLAGFLLGGTFGIGTLVCVLLIGPVADIFMPFNEKWIIKVIHFINKSK